MGSSRELRRWFDPRRSGANGSLDYFADFGVLPAARSGHASMVVGQRFYVFGGGSLVDFQVANIDAGGAIQLSFQTAVPVLPEPRDAPAAITVGNFLYVLGGHNGSSATNTVYRLMIEDPLSLVKTNLGRSEPAQRLISERERR